jgi:hypothetical protein
MVDTDYISCYQYFIYLSVKNLYICVCVCVCVCVLYVNINMCMYHIILKKLNILKIHLYNINIYFRLCLDRI